MHLKGYSVVSATGNVSVCMCTYSTIMFKTCLMIFYIHTHAHRACNVKSIQRVHVLCVYICYLSIYVTVDMCMVIYMYTYICAHTYLCIHRHSHLHFLPQSTTHSLPGPSHFQSLEVFLQAFITYV